MKKVYADWNDEDDVKLYKTRRQIPAKADEANILITPKRGADCLHREIIQYYGTSLALRSRCRLEIGELQEELGN